VLLKEKPQNQHGKGAANKGANAPGRSPHYIHCINPPCRFPEPPDVAQCFIDASIDPEVSQSAPKPAGLGISFLDPRTNTKSYIKLQINNISSVVMAEAAALAFAAAVASELLVQGARPRAR
jgi:hypothetical protein